MNPDELRFIERQVLDGLDRFERLLMFDWEFDREVLARGGRGRGFWNAAFNGAFPETPWLALAEADRRDLMERMRHGIPPLNVRVWNPILDEEAIHWHFDPAPTPAEEHAVLSAWEESKAAAVRVVALVEGLSVRGKANTEARNQILEDVRSLGAYFENAALSNPIEEEVTGDCRDICARIDLRYSNESLVEEFRSVIRQLRAQASGERGARRRTIEDSDRTINSRLTQLAASRAWRKWGSVPQAEAELGRRGLSCPYDNKSAWTKARKRISELLQEHGVSEQASGVSSKR